jgi:hypothetical protein
MKMGTKKTVTAFTFHNLFFIDLSAKLFFIIAEATPQVFKSFVFHSCPLCLFCGPYAFNLHIDIVFPKKKALFIFFKSSFKRIRFFNLLFLIASVTLKPFIFCSFAITLELLWKNASFFGACSGEILS